MLVIVELTGWPEMNVGFDNRSSVIVIERESCSDSSTLTATVSIGSYSPPGATGMLIRQFVLFAAIGALSTACHFAILVALHETANVAVVPATSLGATVGAVVSYALNRRYTFRGSSPTGSAFARFIIVAVGGLVINSAAMAVLQILAAGVSYLVLQCVVTGTVLVYSFTLNKYWTFQDSPTARSN